MELNFVCFVCFVCFICLRADYGLPPRRGEEKPFKGRWHSGLQAPNYRAEQRHGRREKKTKTAQNNSFTQSLFFAVKSKGLQPWVGFNCNSWMHCNCRLGLIATDRCMATAGWVPVATRGCMATVGWVRLQPIDALQLPVGFPLQPLVCFRLQPLVVFGTFGKEKKGCSSHPFSFSTSVFAPANAVMCAGSHPVTQPPDAPRRAVPHNLPAGI